MDSLERSAHWAILAIAVVAVFAALAAAESILAPIVLAFVAGIVLSPITEILDRIGLPHAVAALASFVTGMLVAVALTLLVQPLVLRAADAFPIVWRELNSALYTVQGEMRGIRSFLEEAEALIDQSAETPPPEGDPAAAVNRPGNEAGNQGADEDTLPSVEDVIFMAPGIAAQVLIFVGSLFFFILTRRDLYAWLAVHVAPQRRSEETAEKLRMAERMVAQYFLTISAVNLGLGVCVGVGMAALGMPSPVLWGALAFLMNFFLYLGPTILAAILLVAGITLFDGAQVLAPPLVYLALNGVEAQFITPSLIGRRMSVSPLLIFLAIVVFAWLWGPVGAIVAIPLLLWIVALTSDIREIRAVKNQPA